MNEQIEKTDKLLKMMLPEYIDGVTPETEMADDQSYCVLTYDFRQEHDYEDFLLALEDNCNLVSLYVAERNDMPDGMHHLCSVSDYRGTYLLKVNAVTDDKEMIQQMTVTICESIDVFRQIILQDLKGHLENGFLLSYCMDRRTMIEYVGFNRLTQTAGAGDEGNQSEE